MARHGSILAPQVGEMLAAELVPDLALPDTVVPAPEEAPLDAVRLVRLEETLASEVAPHGSALEVAVTAGHEGIDVRVSGPAADLRLTFDRAELRNPAFVRYVVREAADRYETTLSCRPHWRCA